MDKVKLRVAENASTYPREALADAIEDRTMPTRKSVAEIMHSLFPSLYIHTGGHHVAVCVPGGDRVVLVVGEGGDWN